MSAEVQSYLVQPLLWLATAALSLWLWRRHVGALLPAGPWPLGVGLVLGLMQLAFYVITGLVRGFGSTPYGRTPSLLALNLWFMAARLAGVELARAVLVCALDRRRAWLGLAAGWLLPWLFQVGLWAFGWVSSPASAFSLTARSLLPAATENALATYLVALGGPGASLTYRGVLALFAVLAPALPKLSALTAALLGICAPLVGWLVASEWVRHRRAQALPEVQPQS